jgi:septal ring factor EnvC (AmiA/AmiB activator)
VSDEFVDLRSGNLNSESFWPSFTDIMMVVVMIFLLTSTILMVKNWELVEQLRESMMAELEATEVIRSTSEENATLEEQLAQAQSEISMLRMQLMQASEQNSRLAGILDERDQQIIVILSDKTRLEENLNQSRQEIAVIASETEQLKGDLAKIQTNFKQQSDELKANRDQIIILTEQKDSASKQLTALKDDYGSLKVKYDKLIRPARTAKGKYVVSVNYERIKGNERIRFKDAGAKAYRTLNKKELHTILVKLKKEHKKKLYIKLVIPKESGLTYSEAWNFMKDVLEKYDYYYQ